MKIPKSLKLLLIFLFLIQPDLSFSLTLSKEHRLKIDRLARTIADDLSMRGIRSVAVMDFTDLKGRSKKLEKAVTARFRKAILRSSKGRFTILDKESEVIIKGILLPYKEKDRFVMRIEIISEGSVLSSYTSIFKK